MGYWVLVRISHRDRVIQRLGTLGNFRYTQMACTYKHKNPQLFKDFGINPMSKEKTVYSAARS